MGSWAGKRRERQFKIRPDERIRIRINYAVKLNFHSRNAKISGADLDKRIPHCLLAICDPFVGSGAGNSPSHEAS